MRKLDVIGNSSARISSVSLSRESLLSTSGRKHIGIMKTSLSGNVKLENISTHRRIMEITNASLIPAFLRNKGRKKTKKTISNRNSAFDIGKKCWKPEMVFLVMVLTPARDTAVSKKFCEIVVIKIIKNAIESTNTKDKARRSFLGLE